MLEDTTTPEEREYQRQAAIEDRAFRKREHAFQLRALHMKSFRLYVEPVRKEEKRALAECFLGIGVLAMFTLTVVSMISVLHWIFG